MDISKKSWHYRFNSAMAINQYDIPYSLCPYFWYTILSILKVVGIGIFALIVCTLLYKFLSWWLPSLSIVWSDDLGYSFTAWFIVGVIAFAIARAHVDAWVEAHCRWDYSKGERVLVGSIPWWMTQIKFWPDSKPAEYNPSSFGAVTFRYLDALHDKVCPTLKFVDE